MQDITEKILAHIREKVKETLEEMIKEERRAYLEENLETKANGCYLRSLNTLIGKLEGLRIARVEVWYRSEIAKDLKEIYKASSVEEVREKLKRFADRWGKRYLGVVKWREERAYELLAFMEFPKDGAYIYYEFDRGAIQGA